MILGIHLPAPLKSLAGRSAVLAEVYTEAKGRLNRSKANNRDPVLVFSGMPGSGKSRMAYEVGEATEQPVADVAILALTFNHMHGLHGLTQLSSIARKSFGDVVGREGLTSWVAGLPLLMRLLHGYLAPTHKEWEEFVEEFIGYIVSDFDGAILAFLSLESVIEFPARTARQDEGDGHRRQDSHAPHKRCP